MNFKKAIEIIQFLGTLDDKGMELLDHIIANKEKIDKLPSPFDKLDDFAVEFKVVISLFTALRGLFG